MRSDTMLDLEKILNILIENEVEITYLSVSSLCTPE